MGILYRHLGVFPTTIKEFMEKAKDKSASEIDVFPYFNETTFLDVPDLKLYSGEIMLRAFRDGAKRKKVGYFLINVNINDLEELKEKEEKIKRVTEKVGKYVRKSGFTVFYKTLERRFLPTVKMTK